MGHLGRGVLGVVATVVLVVGWVTPAGALPGTLTAKDVGLPVLSAPHESTVFAYDNVTPGTCETSDSVERDATVVSFGTKTGPALNEVIYEFASKAEAAQFFADAKAADTARADCATTANATIEGIAPGPKGVGDARYTVTSTENVAGKERHTVAISVLSGDTMLAINFLDWTGKQPATKKVAQRALTRLA